ncbi:recombinase-like helix-turn-helix domain-containing protein [Cupriavidus oxalaticus]|uniref:Recombinase-like domain-containing protein n=1 Tax=Cupriavidus oxalaticus TaxID=96344 RepID=A0A375FJD4_9BURK|nr:recombinase-like helix-turn-helix domain-containing protein [Cupriavidus oxalaticus]QRQ85840.1 hypothetical protein JTE91_21475 [Cupriavidus oxalaticus]QRQ95834.1 hypothetical protein JTE92_20785 [Cupriavidus oxalaticus]WQD84512.1 recombinase-like helix-turn-helix domain-containing protein [Cupriavidus oxalaticus]SPC06569.1 conserved hypothetical protein [Cupriavidus oxalaticus]SPC12450.1 conserved hypothetical protein [Cupriavidus oxalaticus]
MQYEDPANPYLVRWRKPIPNNTAGKGYVEQPGEGINIRWQTRDAAPSDYENALADALEIAFEAGARSPEDMVESFSTHGFRQRSGDAWTVQALVAEMRALGK